MYLAKPHYFFFFSFFYIFGQCCTEVDVSVSNKYFQFIMRNTTNNEKLAKKAENTLSTTGKDEYSPIPLTKARTYLIEEIDTNFLLNRTKINKSLQSFSVDYISYE